MKEILKHLVDSTVLPEDEYLDQDAEILEIFVDELEEIFETLKHVYRILKPNGIFITDPDKYKYILESDVMENFDEIRPGIYKKIK